MVFQWFKKFTSCSRKFFCVFWIRILALVVNFKQGILLSGVVGKVDTKTRNEIEHFVVFGSLCIQKIILGLGIT